MKKRLRKKRAAARAMLPGACRRIRESLGLTQGAFAAQLGVTAVTLNRWEQGKTPISKKNALAIQAIETRGIA